MTPNSLDGSTVFAYHNEPTTIPKGTFAPAGDKNQATMDHDQIAPVNTPLQSGHLPVTQVMCLSYTSIGLNPPVTSVKN